MKREMEMKEWTREQWREWLTLERLIDFNQAYLFNTEFSVSDEELRCRYMIHPEHRREASELIVDMLMEKPSVGVRTEKVESLIAVAGDGATFSMDDLATMMDESVESLESRSVEGGYLVQDQETGEIRPSEKALNTGRIKMKVE